MALAASASIWAGNPDRIGQAGALQLNVNGFGRSAGWGLSGVSSVNGLEAMFFNLGGLAYTEKTEFNFSRTNWLAGSQINLNSFGFAQKMGADGVLGLSVTTFDLGNIPITTVNQPDGILGTYSPRFTNIAVGYSKRFTKSISGGVAAKVFSEATANIKTQGFVVDAGVKYVTSSDDRNKFKKDDIHFGVSLRNIGPDTRFSGDGLSAKLVNPSDNLDLNQTVNQRAAKYNMPTSMNISAGYDFRLDKTAETYFHKLTAALTFTNFAFAQNQITGGAQYAYKDLFELRGAAVYEKGVFNYEDRQVAHTGLVGGFSLNIPTGKSNTKIALDYAYRHSNPFSGSHTAGLRIIL